MSVVKYSKYQKSYYHHVSVLKLFLAYCSKFLAIISARQHLEEDQQNEKIFATKCEGPHNVFALNVTICCKFVIILVIPMKYFCLIELHTEAVLLVINVFTLRSPAVPVIPLMRNCFDGFYAK